MTENSDIPSAHTPLDHMLRDNKTIIFAALLVVSVFFLSFLSVLAAEPEEKARAGISNANVQTIKLLEPTTFRNSLAYGGAIYSTVDNALVGNRSALDALDNGFTERTGHSTNLYIVRQGDTISEIAESFGVTANTIRWANDLGKKNLKVGQKLVILPVTGVIHTIKKGDTVSSIAKKYDGVVDDILAYNRIDKEKLVAGDDITIRENVRKSNCLWRKTPNSTESIWFA